MNSARLKNADPGFRRAPYKYRSPVARWLILPIIAVILFSSIPARANFSLVSQDLSIDSKDQLADFSLTFNQEPNFSVLDSQGIPMNSFQVDFDGSDGNLTAVVRGDEIHNRHKVIVRQASGYGGPNSGGWGPVTASVAYGVHGNTVTFAVPVSDLGYTAGQPYQYDAFSLYAGSLTANYQVTSIPLPRGFWMGAVGLSAIALFSFRKRLRFQ